MLHISNDRAMCMFYQFFSIIINTKGNLSTYGRYSLIQTAYKKVRLKHIVYKIAMKYLMKRFIQQIIDRTQDVLMVTIFPAE
jgi:hypothetical protein